MSNPRSPHAQHRTHSRVYPRFQPPAGEEILRRGGWAQARGGVRRRRDLQMWRHRSLHVSNEQRWQVKDVEKEVAELKARGVVFEEYTMPGISMKNGIATAGGAKTAWFKDSEGNIMALSQRLP